MFKNIKAFVFVIVSICCAQPLSADTWTVFLYMDSSDKLSDMAFKNITDAMRGAPNDTVEFIVQLHAYNEVGLRYQVTSTGLIFLQEVHLRGNSRLDLIDAARWVFTDCSSDHVMLILSNHGWGILDPHWDAAQDAWVTDSGDPLSESCTVSCPIDKKRSRLNFDEEFSPCATKHSRLGGRDLNEHSRHKGFLFSVNPRVYLNNQDLVASLVYIKNELLHGKPLDVLAFDTCMGDMLEVAYQVAPYANYLVGNQSCSLVDGFDYQGVVGVLNQGLAPRETTVGMVQVFDTYYTKYDESGIFTHASLDLTQVCAVTQALDAVVTTLFALPNATELIAQAREEAPRFCLWPMYTDPVAFCKNIEAQVADMAASPETQALLHVLHEFYVVVQSCVVARCGGHTTLGRAYGTAIYLPAEGGIIDSSYYATAFGQDSQWIKLLERLS